MYNLYDFSLSQCSTHCAYVALSSKKDKWEFGQPLQGLDILVTKLSW